MCHITYSAVRDKNFFMFSFLNTYSAVRVLLANVIVRKVQDICPQTLSLPQSSQFCSSYAPPLRQTDRQTDMFISILIQ